MALLIDENNLNYTKTRLNYKFNTALRQTFIDAHKNYNTIQNVENNCRRRTPVLDVSRVTCPPVENGCKPYFNECKKNKIFNKQNESNVSYNISQKEQYIRFVRGFGINGHRRISNGSQNFLFTNSNVSNFKNFNNKPNVLIICKQNIILPSVPEPEPEFTFPPDGIYPPMLYPDPEFTFPPDGIYPPML